MQKKESISNTSYYSFGQIQDTTKSARRLLSANFSILILQHSLIRSISAT